MHRITVKYLIGILFLANIYSCSNNFSTLEIPKGEKQFGLYLENGGRQGFQHVDSTGTEYNYRYITSTITNDTTVDIKLEIAFSDNYKNMRLHDSLMSKVFLLPRELTPESQHIDQEIPYELKTFLDTESDKPGFLNKTIKPTEKCVMIFGVLTDVKYKDPTHPFHTTLTINPSTLSLEFNINSHLMIPCGQISYVKN